jgi:hypothetical protein
MTTRAVSIARFFLVAGVMLGATACDSATSPITRAAGDDASYGKANATKTATALTVSAANIAVGQSLTVVATLYTSGHPLGGKKMTLQVDGGAVMTTTGSRLGTGTWTVSGLSAGTHTIVAGFAGDNNYSGSSASTSVTVNP